MEQQFVDLGDSRSSLEQNGHLSFQKSADKWNETILGNFGSQSNGVSVGKDGGSQSNGVSVGKDGGSHPSNVYKNGGNVPSSGEGKHGQYNNSGGVNGKGANSDAEDIGESQPLISSKSTRQKSQCCQKTNFYIYLSHFLSAWGDNMWTFAVGVFLVEIDGDSLQLTASFGLTMGVSTLLLGPIIGDWVDNMPRLRAAQEALVLQNVMIALCAGFVFNLLEFGPEIEDWGEWAPVSHYVLIIVLGTAAFLAHIANTITVERDWVVEICSRDEDQLASMTATMRAIDLTAMIVAPIATGQIMTAASSKIGALFIAGWNVLSFFVEYGLLLKVYHSVPALQKDKNFSGESSAENSLNPRKTSELVESMGQSRTLMTASGRTHSFKTHSHAAVESQGYGDRKNSSKVLQTHGQNSCLKR